MPVFYEFVQETHPIICFSKAGPCSAGSVLQLLKKILKKPIFKKLAEFLGDPYKSFKSIHIAGTNWKRLG
jgi:hypothetical protein